MIGEDCRLMFVLKADAYGHGTPVCARYSEDLVDWYAAATIDEALSIRRAGVEKPILLFGMLLDQDIPAAVDARLTVNACSLEYARPTWRLFWSEWARPWTAILRLIRA